MTTLTKNAKAKRAPMLRAKDFGNTASDEATIQCLQRKEDAQSLAGLGASKFVANMCSSIPFQLATTDIDTMAVTMSGDGTKFLLLNPEFTNSLEKSEDVLFVLYHECLHLLLNHLQRDPELRGDDTWKYACEAVINAVLLERTAKRDMPRAVSVDENGKTVSSPTGIDPRAVYKDYVKQCGEAGLSTVSYEAMMESESACYSELKRLPNPPGDKPKQQVCIHQGDNADGSASGSGTQMDQDTVDQVVKDAIHATMTEARQGNEKARAELLKLAEMTEGDNEEAKRLWGSYGIMGLRGLTDATRKVEWWKQWVVEVVGSLLQPGQKTVFPRKRAGVMMTLGQDPMLARRGDEQKKILDVYNDTSGSMPTNVIDWLSKLVGIVDGLVIRFYMFDGTVERLIPGETVRGGGGTNFQNCIDHAEGRLEIEGDDRTAGDADAIIMLTDGYAPHVTPADPDKWIWLITKGGDDWPETHNPPMLTHIVDTTDE